MRANKKIFLGLLLGLILAIFINSYFEQEKSLKNEQKVESTKTDLKNISRQLRRFKKECGSYPTSEEGIKIAFGDNTRNCDFDYLDGKTCCFGDCEWNLKDPWENEYIYSSNNNDFTLISLGSDGQEGGVGFAKDISYQFKKDAVIDFEILGGEYFIRLNKVYLYDSSRADNQILLEKADFRTFDYVGADLAKDKKYFYQKDKIISEKVFLDLLDKFNKEEMKKKGIKEKEKDLFLDISKKYREKLKELNIKTKKH